MPRLLGVTRDEMCTVLLLSRRVVRRGRAARRRPGPPRVVGRPVVLGRRGRGARGGAAGGYGGGSPDVQHSGSRSWPRPVRASGSPSARDVIDDVRAPCAMCRAPWSRRCHAAPSPPPSVSGARARLRPEDDHTRGHRRRKVFRPEAAACSVRRRSTPGGRRPATNLEHAGTGELSPDGLTAASAGGHRTASRRPYASGEPSGRSRGRERTEDMRALVSAVATSPRRTVLSSAPRRFGSPCPPGPPCAHPGTSSVPDSRKGCVSSRQVRPGRAAPPRAGRAPAPRRAGPRPARSTGRPRSSPPTAAGPGVRPADRR